ncbi:DUF3025 domain-containing protein [Algicola sagamiensis]|uniref:DUF3025 domain-containing protein n=1 Tax=Algicola sagamiensis TaxID=163869 RepID=UPI000363048F|nr:DUF3025 domain-containing protein [Algicola sagamiensis]
MTQQRFQPLTEWSTYFLDQFGLFRDLKSLFPWEHWKSWPRGQELTRCLPEGVVNSNGESIRFIDQFPGEDFHGRYYEQIIFEDGTIPTRVDNWHDLFGALIWCLFPKTKALLNQLHIQDIKAYGHSVRTDRRNAITLFDECGVVMAISEPDWRDKLQAHEWHQAFWQSRDAWGESIHPFMFGHANYEMATKPYLGLTGKALFVPVASSFFSLPLWQVYQQLDAQLETLIQSEDLLNNNKIMSPIPFLGIPGWYDDNQQELFYANTAYFRPKRRKP